MFKKISLFVAFVQVVFTIQIIPAFAAVTPGQEQQSFEADFRQTTLKEDDEAPTSEVSFASGEDEYSEEDYLYSREELSAVCDMKIVRKESDGVVYQVKRK